MGLLLPPFLIWMFDCGVFRTREMFAKDGSLMFVYDGDMEDKRVARNTLCEHAFFKWLPFAGLAVGVSYHNDIAGALCIVLSGFTSSGSSTRSIFGVQ